MNVNRHIGTKRSENFAEAGESMCPYYRLYDSLPAWVTVWIDRHKKRGAFAPRKNVTNQHAAHHPNRGAHVRALQALPIYILSL